MPKSNIEFWERKFGQNVRRDERVEIALRERGWEVVVVWECQIHERLQDLAGQIATAVRDRLAHP
jgi:DNA mismatch endonuclease (patch repair protein)